MVCLALKLALPFMSLDDIGKILTYLSKDDLKFYFIERFKLHGVDAKIINNELDIYPALMDRITNSHDVMEKILNNRFICNPRLKVRMYLAVKNNNSVLMHYYNDNHHLLYKNYDHVTLTPNDIELLLGVPFPITIDDRRFVLYPHENQIKIHTADGDTCCIIDLATRHALVVENNKDIVFVLCNLEILMSLYKGSNNKRKIYKTLNGHRRPKIRRR